MIKVLGIAGIFFACFAFSASAQTADSTAIAPTSAPLVKELTKRTFIKDIYDFRRRSTPWSYKGNKPAVIVLYANWCVPCKQMTPIVEQLALRYSDKVKFYKINTDTEKELSHFFQAEYIPMFILIPMQDLPQKINGAMDQDLLENKMKEILNLK